MRSAVLFVIFICIHQASTESSKGNRGKLETFSNIRYDSLFVNVARQEDFVKVKSRNANESTTIIEATEHTTIKDLKNSTMYRIGITGEISEEQFAHKSDFVDELTDIDGRAARVRRGSEVCGSCRNAQCQLRTGTTDDYYCMCLNGYTGTGFVCTDIDECAYPPGPCNGNATCNNTVGSYKCTCNVGFSGNGKTCTDIDDCIPYPCETFNRSSCHDLINNYSCSCLENFSGDGNNTCGRVDGLRLTGRSEETTREQGYVEILARPDGDWRTICHPGWTEAESKVVCHMLGYKRVSFLPVTVQHLERIDTWLDNVSCNGDETHLQDCKLGKFGVTNCNTKNRVKVRCSNTTVQNDTAELYYKTLNGTIYNFVSKFWEANRLTRSLETCGVEGRAASIECRKETYPNGSFDMDFDHSTLRELHCNTSTKLLLEEIPLHGNVSDKLAATILGDLSAISDNSTSSTFNDGNTTEMAQIINELNGGLNKSGSNVGKSAAFYLVWSTDNFHRILSEVNSTRNDDNTFNDIDKLKLINSLNGMATRFVFQDRNVTIETDAIIFKSQALNDTNETAVEFQGYTGEGRENVLASLSLPSSMNPDEPKLIYSNFYLHRDSLLFPKVNENTENDTKVDEVLSIQHNGNLAENSTEELNVSFPRDMNEEIKKPAEAGKLYFRRCGYLNSRTRQWETDMCTTIILTGNATKCKCTRTKIIIGFSVLVKTYDVGDSVPLGIVGIIGCVSSTVSLVILLVVYSYFTELRTNKINQIHMNLSVCLMTSYITFLLGIQRVRDYVSCMSVAAILHFSIISAWGWMLVESVTMYRKFIQLSRRTGDNYVIKCAAVVYTVTACGVLVNTVVASQLDDEMWRNWTLAYEGDIDFRPSIYIADKLCWLHRHSLYFGFLGPIGLILILNIVIGIVVTRKITGESKIRSSKSKVEMSDHIVRTFMIAILLGIPWVIGVPLTFTNVKEVHEVFGWIFTIFNAFQGVLIFVFFGVRNNEARQLCAAKLGIVKASDSSIVTAQSRLNTNQTGTSSNGEKNEASTSV